MSEKSNILCVIILFGAVYGFVHSTTDDELLLFKTDGLFAKTHTIKKKIAFVLESYQRQMEQLKALQKDALCPWDYEIEVNTSYVPEAIQKARCTKAECHFIFPKTSHCGKAESLMKRDTECTLVFHEVMVLDTWTWLPVWKSVPAACVCSRNDRHYNSSDYE